jgi:hypothetical protein
VDNAGNVPLEIKVTSPTGINGKISHIFVCFIRVKQCLFIVPLKIDDASPRSTVKKVRFTPNETGVHYLNAKFGSEIVPGNELVFFLFTKIFVKKKGTPIKMMVNDARLVTAYGDGIHHALHEKPAAFMIDTQDMQGDLKVRIEGMKNQINNFFDY